MIPGGIADKLGNRYEAKWLVRKLIDVILGRATNLHFEGIGDEFAGFEFSVVVDGNTQWHQAKISTTSGNWTVGRLRSEGVLGSFKAKFKTTDFDTCHFVSQDAAHTLRDLAERAFRISSLEQFRSSLSSVLTKAFNDLVECWDVSDDQALEWLRRSAFRIESEQAIEEAIESHGRICVAAHTKEIFALLRDYLEQRMNRTLTIESVRDELPRAGIPIRAWDLDPTVKERLATATNQYLSSYPTFPAASRIVRQEALDAAEELSAPGGAKTILVTGTAGSGKSGVIRLLIDELRTRQITHLAFRADAHMGQRPEDIGENLTGERESPVVTLQRISESSTAVLIIDQIDAVSEVSGRDPNLKQHLLRMVHDANHLPSVRVVCVCRSFDIETDERLRAMGDDFIVRRIDVPPLVWEKDVEPVLRAKGIAASRFSPSQKVLLSSPLNLSLFLEVGCDEDLAISRTDLFRKLTQKAKRDIARIANPAWSVEAALQRLAQRMSQNQTLQAPLSTLNEFDGAADILASANLIAITGNNANFFHESFFDFLFARHFQNGSETLVDLLLRGEQHLFRRTQVRQILEVLRQDDYVRYLDEIRMLLENARVRFHIKLAVAQWLGSIRDPSFEELTIALSLDDSPEYLNPLFRAVLLGSVGWFDLFFTGSDFFKTVLMEGTDERLDMVLWLLTKTAQTRPAEVAELLDDWLNADARRTERFLEWLTSLRGTTIAPQLLELGRKAVHAIPDYLLVAENRYRSAPLLDSLGNTDTDFVVFAIKTYFDAWFARHPDDHPFLEREIRFDIEALEKLATRNPDAFLSATLEALRRTVDCVSTRLDSRKSDATFYYRQFGEQYLSDDKFLALFRRSLQTLARDDVTKAIEYLNRLNPAIHIAILHLHLETIAANGRALGVMLLPLLKQKRLFEAGWSNASAASFANAAHATRPHLDSAQWSEVEERILGHQPELDAASSALAATHFYWGGDKRQYALSLLSLSGEEVWTVLEMLGEENLSVGARQRLDELRRKFVGRTVSKPEALRVHTVGSPISQSAVQKMGDDDWLNAFDTYRAKSQSNARLPIDSAPFHLASQLSHVAEQQPARFAALVPKIPNEYPTVYIQSILTGIAAASIKDESNRRYGMRCPQRRRHKTSSHKRVQGKLRWKRLGSMQSARTTKRLVLDAIRNAHSRPGQHFGEAIAGVIEKHPTFALEADVFEILYWYAENGTLHDMKRETPEEKDGPITIQRLMARSERLYLEALSGQRGQALRTLSAVQWHVNGKLPKVWDLLQSRVLREEDASVRVVLVSCIKPLIQDDKYQSAELLKELVKRPSSSGAKLLPSSVHVLATNEATHVVAYLLRNVVQSGRYLVDAMLASEEADLRALGAWHIIHASFYFDEYITEADVLMRTSADYARLGATCATHAIKDGELTERALKKLTEFFESTDADVHESASEAFRNVAPVSFHRIAPLALAYIASTSLQHGAFSLLYGLERATGDVSEIVVRVAEQVVKNARKLDRKSRRATDLQQVRALLSREYAGSERNPTRRTRILDVLDTMLELDLFGAEDVVQAHERN
ncbi:AAA family ATPase [Paraburkholderia caffeinilytica]|uniref:AAA family ATPase n=1 Tax=Paraburkholderia caffeinilytica TaxID=1761016 RepID=UPI0038BDF792